MGDAGALTFREFAMREPLPLATLHNAVLEFLRDRDDVVVFGAQAVNAYVDEPRMTQDIDLLSVNAEPLAQMLCDYLRERFHIAVRVRTIAQGQGLRLFHVRKSGNRHLVDIRSVPALPRAERIAGILVMAPAELIASKVLAFQQRRGQPKSGTDWRDLAMLLLTFPELKQEHGPVAERLTTAGGGPEAFHVWRELVAQNIRLPDDEEDGF